MDDISDYTSQTIGSGISGGTRVPLATDPRSTREC